MLYIICKTIKAKRQINNFGAGYQQTYMGGGMGGFGPVNNNGPNYVQTYGKRNIGQYFEMKFTKKTTHMYMGKFNTYIKQFKPKNLLKKFFFMQNLQQSVKVR